MESRGLLLGSGMALAATMPWGSLTFLPPASAPASVSPSVSAGIEVGQSLNGPNVTAEPGAARTSTFAMAAAAGAGVGAARTAMRAAKRTKGAKAGKADPAPPSQPPKFDPTAQIGAVPFYFDPLGFSADATYKSFWHYRHLELKHGRIAMLAAVGSVMQHFLHRDIPIWKLYLPTSPQGLGALAVFYGPEGFFQLTGCLFAVGVLEAWFATNQQKEAGNFGDPLGLGQYTPEMRNIELNNARFAMISIMIIVIRELTSGQDAVQQLGLGL